MPLEKNTQRVQSALAYHFNDDTRLKACDKQDITSETTKNLSRSGIKFYFLEKVQV